MKKTETLRTELRILGYRCLSELTDRHLEEMTQLELAQLAHLCLSIASDLLPHKEVKDDIDRLYEQIKREEAERKGLI